MKQNITRKQFQELTEDQLINICKLAKWDLTRVKELNEYFTLSEDVGSHKILNIGSMIELLCESKFGFPYIGKTESSKRSELIVIGVTSIAGSKEFYQKTFEGNDLCDALWESLKSVLKS